ncbi:MAG TPA: hypothetical protein DCY88_31720 [Cyanobacteria bacterium UBA11372]|nr:hypothetical protein [Cyanobacteria bacterium UBA11372]
MGKAVMRLTPIGFRLIFPVFSQNSGFDRDKSAKNCLCGLACVSPDPVLLPLVQLTENEPIKLGCTVQKFANGALIIKASKTA